MEIVGEGAGDATPRELNGGQVATAALALARLEARCAYAGAVGDDAAGDAVLRPLREAGVDCTAVLRVAGGRTRRAVIRVDGASGERTVRPDRDPNVRLEPGALDRGLVESARALLIDAEDPEVSRWAARVASDAKIPVVLDPGPPGEAAESLLPLVDFPIVSHEFAESLCNGSVREALRSLALRARHLAVVTLGAGGAIAQLRGGTSVIESPAFEVAARDTTGAGDVFHAAFVWGLLRGLGVRAVLRTANAAAALSCRALGAQGGLPDRETLTAFLESHAAR
ncbi:MAG: carbohydrate kinase family protein [Myxococcota bacterium]|nr:carbohydrate kinase family protein [Myxococcota bacterium]